MSVVGRVQRDVLSAEQCLLLDAVCMTRNLTTIDESASILSPSDISFDKTGEDLDGSPVPRSAKRPSAPSADDDENDESADDDIQPPRGKRSRRQAVSI